MACNLATSVGAFWVEVYPDRCENLLCFTASTMSRSSSVKVSVLEQLRVLIRLKVWEFGVYEYAATRKNHPDDKRRLSLLALLFGAGDAGCQAHEHWFARWMNTHDLILINQPS